MEFSAWAICEASLPLAKAWVDFDSRTDLTEKKKAKLAKRLSGRIRYMQTDANGFPAAWVAPSSNDEKIGGKIAIIPIQGTMVKGGYWWGYADQARISELVKRVDADSSFVGTILHCDSGGGTVDGTDELAATVAACKKPVLAFVDGTSASANLWVASQAREVMVASNTTCFLGSIGVLQLYIGQSRLLSDLGIDVEIMRSTKSPDKARPNAYEPLTDEVRAEQIKVLDDINTLFHATVKKGRAGKLTEDGLKNGFTGKMFSGKEAIKMGFADRVGSLQDAIKRVSALATQNEKQGTKADQELADMELKDTTKPAAETQPAAPATPAAPAAEAPAAEAPTPAETPAATPTPTASAAPVAPAADDNSLEARVARMEEGQKSMNESLKTISGWIQKGSVPSPGADTSNGGDTSKPARKLSAFDQEMQALYAKHNPEKANA